MNLGFQVQKPNVGIRIRILEKHVCQFSGKKDNFYFSLPNLPKNGFRDQNSKNLSPDLESVPLTYHVCQFSVKMNNFECFGLKLGKLPIYLQQFGSNNVKVVVECWVEAEMGLMEVNEAGWSWVEMVAQFSNTQKYIYVIQATLRIFDAFY